LDQQSAIHRSLPGADEGLYLNATEFDELTERLIYAATSNHVLPADALSALAKALGTLCAFSARRHACPLGDILKATQDAAADSALAAEDYMRQNQDVNPASIG
jgi:hypothetical protein